MAKTPRLSPEDQFPKQAIQESVQVQPKPEQGAQWQGGIADYLTIGLASVADQITPWGRNVKVRDRQLREFWPTESFLSGALVNVSFRNTAFDWEIQGPSDAIVTAVTDMLRGAIAGDSFGWVPYMGKLSEDLYSQDNGAFVELIRDPGMDATSKFKGPMAPVIGIAHLDAGQCARTGNAEYPILYTDRQGVMHKMAWYEVIPLSDYPSSIERMNGVGYCAVTRALRLAQIMKNIAVFKDEKVGGRHFKAIHLVGGVSRVELEDAKKRTHEDSDNKGLVRYMDPVVLASLDPEKPVSVATLDFASLPDGFDYDQEMQWYIAGLALDFGVDYQEFAPLPGGNIGSSAQSVILHKKSSGKGPRVFMRTLIEAFQNYGVIPRGYKMIFNDRNEQEEMEKQEIRTKATEEAVMNVRAGILTPEAARQDLVRRGIFTRDTVLGIAEDYGDDIVMPKQNLGATGGSTVGEDVKRKPTGKPNETGAKRLTKAVTDLLRKPEKIEKQDIPVPINIVNDVKQPMVVVKLPKVKSTKQVVHRNANGDISHTTTEYEYEP
jgi:hypothetical protein